MNELDVPTSSTGDRSSSGAMPGSAAALDMPRIVRLSIKCPSSEAPNSEGEILSVSATTTIAQVKKQIETTWPGRPKAEGMRCIRAGRLLSDEESVGDVLAGTDLRDPASLHLVVRPDAWSTPPRLARTASNVSAAGSPALLSTPNFTTNAFAPAAAPIPTHADAAVTAAAVVQAAAASVAAAAAATSSPNAAAANTPALPRIIESMSPASYVQFQGLVLWACHLNLDAYQALWHRTYGGPELASSLHAIRAATSMTEEELRKAVATLEKDVLGWEELEEFQVPVVAQTQESETEQQHIYQQINVGNMPYLLRLTRTAELEAANARLGVLHARYTALRDLHVRLSRLIAFHSASSGARTTSSVSSTHPRQRRAGVIVSDAARAIPRFDDMPQAQQAGATAQAGVNVQPAARLNPDPLQDPATRRRVVILLLLHELTHVALPMLYLSLKLAMLVYVFTRGASPTKRWCMIAAASLYVLYEGWRIMSRRRRTREREVRGRTRRGTAGAAGADATPAAAANATPDAAPSAAEDDGLPVIPPIPATQAPLRHRATSPLTLAYWMEAIAYLNLATEDEALGFTLPNTPTRAQANARARARAAQQGWPSLFYVRLVLPLILFVGTLVPEVELRRRRAIEERENLIRQTALLQEDRERIIRERQAEIEKRQREKNAGEASGSTEKQPAPTPTAAATTAVRRPSILRNTYADRVLRQRRVGQGARQIDIQEELDAQAAAGDEMDAEEDLGFF